MTTIDTMTMVETLMDDAISQVLHSDSFWQEGDYDFSLFSLVKKHLHLYLHYITSPITIHFA